MSTGGDDESGTVRTLQFQALQSRAIDSIKAGKLELGLAKGKQLHEVSHDEFDDIAHEVGLQRGEPKRN